MKLTLHTLFSFILLGCLLLHCNAAAYSLTFPAPPPLTAEGSFFKDADGRVVLLRGVNATGDAKVPPFQTLTDPKLLDPLPGWGINVVRLLFNWEAFEPEKYQYDNTYLAYYQQLVWWAAERGLYVIVDFHQDAFSRFSIEGCGDGFPYWTIDDLIGRYNPRNDDNCVNWGTSMIFDLDHHLTWNYFHQNKGDVRTRFLSMLESVASSLAGIPNIIGYDIINEPWGDDSELIALFEDAGAVIENAHPGAIFFVSAHALVSGIGSNTMRKPNLANFAYSPHYYDATIYLSQSWLGINPKSRLDDLREKSVKWKVPMFLGEFGASETTGNGDDYIEGIYQWLDRNFISGAQWNYTPGWTPEKKDGWNGEDFSIVDEKGRLRSMFKPRPYPQKTAGTPVRFSRGEDGFRYSWRNNPSLGSTEFFLPSGYETGKIIKVINGTGNCSITDQRLICNIPDTALVELRFYTP